MNPGWLIVSAALAVGGIGTVLVALVSRHRGQASEAWPHVTGHVMSSSVCSGESADRPIVDYSYSVDDRAYRGDKICFGTEVSFLSPAQAQAYVDQYPPGSGVTVYYDPANPHRSVLLQGIPKQSDRLIASGLVMALIGVVGTLIGLIS